MIDNLFNLILLTSNTSNTTYQENPAPLHILWGKREQKSLERKLLSYSITITSVELRRNPIEDGAFSGFSGQKSVPE